MLALYRRHRLNCKGRHPHNSRTSEYDERKKGWRRCECPIYASGTLHGNAKRQNTGRWEWDAARGVAERFRAAGSWSGSSPESVQAVAPPKSDSRITIERAIKAFTAEFEEHAAPNTQKKYRILLGKLKAFAESRGYIMVD